MILVLSVRIFVPKVFGRKREKERGKDIKKTILIIIILIITIIIVTYRGSTHIAHDGNRGYNKQITQYEIQRNIMK